MPVYEYKGLDDAGKAASGMVDADTARAARVKLRKQGVFTTSIIEGKGGAIEGSPARNGDRPKGQGLSVEVDLSKYLNPIGITDVAIATRQLSALLGAGIPIVESMEALSEQVEKEQFRLILREIRQKVNEGTALADALEDYPKVFSTLYVNMVRAGERAGALEHVLERLADYTEGSVELRGKVASALTYPAIMLLVALGVIGFMMAYVVPKITKLFQDMGADLPLITKLVIAASDILQNYWWLLAVLTVGGAIGLRYWYGTEAGRQKADDLILRIPSLGRMFLMVSVARFASTLSTLMMSGVPLLTAMGIVRNVVTNVVLQDIIATAQEAVREGQPMNRPLRKSGRFPPMVVHMISVGEKTGELSPMLNRVATTYEAQVNRRLATLTALLEPLMILVMGGIVFVIALAVLLPMLQMNTLAGG
ncbi:MAG TPA: type II secretion system protein GspF [Deltaproteobacteria bacterium]|nr:type II secretion system protein GspF [Deltaproteobacteria bacterium]HCP44784.1 type II secretion system protein GspF [Deltaproteobacteria bacterium]